MKKSKPVKRVPQSKLKEYYRLVVQIVGFEMQRVALRDWFIVNRKRPVQKGDFKLNVIPVPTATVDLKKFERRMRLLPKAQTARVMRMLRGCVVRGMWYRVDVRPIR